jgi:photosystem II stability/assembly factor-like uncharacterized protein
MSKCIYYFLLGVSLPGLHLFAQLESIGPEGGYIQCMVTDNQENILASTRFGGIYKTTNFGDSWSQIFTGYRNLDVRSLAVNTNNNYFAGTDAGGFFRSTNGGASWENINNILSTLTIQSLLTTPDNGIYAGTLSGLYKSTDNGTTFSPASNGITTSLISSIGYSENYLLAGTSYAGIFRSTDNAVSWQPFNNGLDFNSRSVTRIEIFGSSQTPYISLGDKFYYYDESMGSWEAFTDPPKYIDNFIITDVRGVSSIVGAASTNITTQGGGIISHPVTNQTGSWTIENAPEKSCGSIVKTSQGILAGYYGIGVVGSTDGLNTFPLKNTDLFASNITAIRNVNGTIFVGTATGQVWISSDGLHWINLTYDLPPEYINDVDVDPDDGKIYASTPNGVYALYQSVWVDLPQPYAGESIGINSQSTIAIGIGSSMYISHDHGQSWAIVNTGAPGVKNIVFDYNDKAYISATDQFNFQSNGVLTADPPNYDNWVQLGTGLENKIITNVSFVDNGTFTSGCTGDIYAGTKDSKLFIFNNGQFTEHSDGITSTNPITSIVSTILPTNTIPTIELMQETVSIYNPQLCSNTTKNLLSDIRIRQAIAYSIGSGVANKQQKGDSENLYIYYGTVGTGILREDLLSDVEIISSDLPTNYSLEQNYPNPFNPSTTIRFSITKESFTKLEIFNSLGEKVSTLVSEHLRAGAYKYEWNAKEFASGIYFYTLTAGDFQESKKLILLK